MILALQAKLLEIAYIEDGLQIAMNDLQKEVGALQKTAKKVDNMDVMLKLKIPILNHLNKTVDVHREAIAQVSIEVERKSLSLSSFKGEKRSAVSE